MRGNSYAERDMNTALSPRERAEKLLPLMTLEEKVGQMMQISSNRVSFEEADEWVVKRFAGSFLHTLEDRIDHIQNLTRQTRLQIPMLFGIDAIHGHALHNGATIFPTQLAMSCSWNPELIEKAGRVTAREVSAMACTGPFHRYCALAET
jgi:beta-glucosidase